MQNKNTKIKLNYSIPCLKTLDKRICAVCFSTGSAASNTGDDNGFAVCNDGVVVFDSYTEDSYCDGGSEANNTISNTSPCASGSGDNTDWVNCSSGVDKA